MQKKKSKQRQEQKVDGKVSMLHHGNGETHAILSNFTVHLIGEPLKFNHTFRPGYPNGQRSKQYVRMKKGDRHGEDKVHIDVVPIDAFRSPPTRYP